NGGATGLATVNVSGGTAGYSYLRSPGGGTNATATGLAAGNYTVTVTDASGCTQTATAVIAQPSTLIATVPTPANILCNGGATGTASVNVSGGTAGYSYLWSPSGGTGATATGLAAGKNRRTASNESGCTQTASAVIAQPSTLVATVPTPANILCNGGATGTATVNV